MHWDGSQWSTVSSPNVGTSSNWLYGVQAVAPNDVWAVGYYRAFNPDPIDLNLALHYDGTAWQPATVPNVGTYNNHLHAVSASGPSNVWAVGSYKASLSAPEQTLVMQWDGAQWAPIASPNANTGSYNILRGVDVLSPTDAWAVGYYDPGSGPDQTLTLRWNGTSWAVVPSANAPTGFSLLYSVDARAADDVWAVGYNSNPPGGQVLPLVTHWDGTAWNYETTPAPGSQSNFLYGVTALSATEVWVFGQQNSGAGSRTLSMRWNGSTWNVMATANASGANYVTDGLALPSGDAWLVGYSGPAGGYSTLTARYTTGGCGPTPSPSATATAPPPTSTATPTQPAATATATVTPPQPSATLTVAATNTPGTPTTATATVPVPTACTLMFEDVPVTNTFYPFVRCLACQGIVSGYPCGGDFEPCNANEDPYFRPNNYVTRGQLSKIVSQSAGFNEPVPATQQTFEDVPYGSTFWEFVERLYSRGVIGGYQCGVDPNEPCVPPEDRPYFRPDTGATRGQLTKIVSESAGYTDVIPADQQTFTDAPPNSTFWVYIERLLTHNPDVMQGYPCGQIPSEPCDSENRPYFRPNNPLTRGQTSKIVANTFFPDCNPPRP
jgi:hypothetical protein